MLPKFPARRLAIVTCMDVRIDPLRVLGLKPGDAHVIRNAGGAVTDDVIRSLAVSQRLLGTEQVALVMHTDCGMQGLSDSEFRDRVQSDAGVRPPWPTEGFTDLEQAVRDGVVRLRTSPFLVHRDEIRGYVYVVETEMLRDAA